MDPADLLSRYGERVTHVERVPARDAVVEPWPDWVSDRVRAVFEAEGASELWAHQAEGLRLVHDGRHVVVSTGTASGKSLVFQVPALEALAGGRSGSSLHGHRSPTVLYLAPTKALAADQRRRLHPGGRPRARGDGRRRQQPRRARLGARPRRLRVDESRHAAPLHPSGARPVDAAARRAALRRGRRVPPLPRGVRCTRRARPAPAASRLRALRHRSRVHPVVGHGGRAGRLRPAAHRTRRRRRHRRRLAARGPHHRAVGTTPDRCCASDSAAGPALGEHRGGRDPHRPRRRRHPDARVRAVAARGRGGRGRRPATPQGGRPVTRAHRRHLPRRLPPRGAARARAATA